MIIYEFFNKLKSWQVALILIVIGFAIFWTGFNGPFLGDDQAQIQQNTLINSVTSIPHYFFENNNGTKPEVWIGAYYRPVMLSTFTLINVIFGQNPIAFHVLQLLIFIFCAFFVFLIFKKLFSVAIAIAIAILFLVHPINSQAVYLIAAMQEPLFMFFGLLALILIIYSKSNVALFFASFCLLLSMLSKESGILFAGIALTYLLIHDFRRAAKFSAIISLTLLAFFLLKTNATGADIYSENGPIGELSLWQRLLMIPSILIFYLSKFIFPYQLATFYNWTHSVLSFNTFILPLLILLVITALLIYFGDRIRSKLDIKYFKLYIFFIIWLSMGLLLHMQIIPLDLTASETWFVFPILGAFGIITLILKTYQKYIPQFAIITVVAMVVFIFGVRTSLRGLDYSSEFKLAQQNIKVSQEDWYSHTVIAREFINQKKYNKAKYYAEKSVSIKPTNQTYNDLAIILTATNDIVGATNAYIKALEYVTPGNMSGNGEYTYDKLDGLMLVYPNKKIAEDYYINQLKNRPNNCVLLQNYGLFIYGSGDKKVAKDLFSQISQQCRVDATLYSNILNEKSFSLVLGDTGIIINF